MALTTYLQGFSGAQEAGQLVWKHLKRLDEESSLNDVRGVFSGIGVVGSLVTCGVNLAMGGRNMKRDQVNNHIIAASMSNLTPYTIAIERFEETYNGSLKSCVIPVGESRDLELGTRNYAGESMRNKGPIILCILDDGANTSTVQVRFMDSSDSGFSGQIRLRSIVANDDGAEDASGQKANSDMWYPFYRCESNDARPSCMVTATPVSNGHCDIAISFLA